MTRDEQREGKGLGPAPDGKGGETVPEYKLRIAREDAAIRSAAEPAA